MPRTPAEVVRAILDDSTDVDAVRELVAPDATCVSLSYDGPGLKRLMVGAHRRSVIEGADTMAVFDRLRTAAAFRVDAEGGEAML